jgi:hypothetical protein
MAYPWTAHDILTAADLNDAIGTGIVKTGLSAGTDFTPTLVQSGAVTKTVNYARYTKIGRYVLVNYYLTVTGSGTGANVIFLGLPLAAATSGLACVGTGMVFDSSASTFWHGPAIVATSTTVKFAAYNAGNYLGAAGMTAGLASGDILSAFIAYEGTS